MLLLAAFVAHTHAAIVLPALQPVTYQHKQLLEVKVGKVDSPRTNIPFEYYQLPLCQPTNIKVADNENLGEVLSGDVWQNSEYQVAMKIVSACNILCQKTYTKQELQQLEQFIADDYRVNWMMDNLPAATRYYTEVVDTQRPNEPAQVSSHLEKGFALGFIGSEQIPGTIVGHKYINNHHRLTIQYHEDPAQFVGYRIVGFQVEPFSVEHTFDHWQDKDTQLNTCNPLNKVTHQLTPQTVSDENKDTIIFTYDVDFERVETTWAHRWELYQSLQDAQIHWFSVVNSIVIVIFLSVIVAVIMCRILKRDFNRYSMLDSEEAEAAQEETGWKLVRGDVFRPPTKSNLFIVLVGSGAQVFGMVFSTIAFAMLGFLSPANRGGLMTALLLLFVLSGFLAGYACTWLSKILQRPEWRRNTLFTALLFPGVIFFIFFLVNSVFWSQKSSAAVPFSTFIILLLLWFGVSVPLVYLGAWFGNKTETKLPTKTLMIPRVIPEQPFYMSSWFTMLVGGILPFGAVFIEVFFVLSSVWHHQYYFFFGFLFIVFVILIITCAEVTIVLTYFQLVNEDYNWWYRSLLSAGSTGIYLFVYSLIYFYTKLQITSAAASFIYFAYSIVASLALFSLCSFIGFGSSFSFIYYIYSSIKCE